MDKAGIFGIKMIIAGHEWYLKNTCRTVFLMQETATVYTNRILQSTTGIGLHLSQKNVNWWIYGF